MVGRSSDSGGGATRAVQLAHLGAVRGPRRGLGGAAGADRGDGGGGGVDLGGLNLWIAMAIATVKATLVVLYFMHMRYDRPVNAIVFVTALAVRGAVRRYRPDRHAGLPAAS